MSIITFDQFEREQRRFLPPTKFRTANIDYNQQGDDRDTIVSRYERERRAMEKPNSDDSQSFDRSSSSSPLPSLPPPPSDFDMNWQTILNQSEPTIHCRSNPLLHHLSTTACNSSSYRVSIGQEVVNITEIARHRHQPSTAGIMPMEQRRTDASRKGVNILSLCFMCFVSVSLILIAISTLHLLLKTPQTIPNEIVRYPLNLSSASLSMYNVPETVVNVMVPVYDRTLRELAAVLCIFVVVLNCFSLLIFSLEIYLTCNMVKKYSETVPCCLFDASTARFVAICSYYGSIPAFILVMCLFILLNLSLLPAVISLVVLGCSLVFILLTLITYFFTWRTHQSSFSNGKLGVINSSIYRTAHGAHFCDDDLDLAKLDELSTLV